VIINGGHFAARYAGLKASAVYYDSKLVKAALRKTILDLEPDMGGGSGGLAGSGTALEFLHTKQLLWPGYYSGADVSHQCVEKEYKREDKYDLFNTDPTDFILRRYLPRVFEALSPLSKLSPIMPTNGAAAFTNTFYQFGAPDVRAVFDVLLWAGQGQGKWRRAMGSLEDEKA